MTAPVVPLGELCEMDRRGLPPDDPVAARLPLLGVENIGSHTGALNLDTGSRVGEGRSTTFRFDERHVLYGKLRPYLNKVATPDQSKAGDVKKPQSVCVYMCVFLSDISRGY